MAIAEMNKSKNEPRPDGKVPPKVGAVIVFPDGRVEKAHRGELRDGNHAEFTLLERKFPGENVQDCILFTTLEPCVERNPPKTPCCKRITGARIKKVYVGIEDPDITVDGKGIQHLEDNKVIVKMFDRDLQQKIEKANARFIKQANERKSHVKTDVAPSNLELPVANITYDEFSAEALQKFIIEAKLSFKIEKADFKKYLTTLGALVYDSKTKKYQATGFGVLLFGFNPRLTFKQAALMAHVDYGSDKIEPATFDQPLVLIPDLIEEWLYKVLPLSKNTKSFKRKDVPDFPPEVLREAVINAIVHRDYSIAGAKSTLEIDNDKIVVKSPGAPLPSISLEQLNTFNAPSISRNPIITYVFSLMKYVEEKGFGMKSLKSLNQKFGLPLPEYTLQNPFLQLTFPRTMESVKRVGNKALGKLTEAQVEGYEWIRLKGSASTREYSAHFNIGYKTAQRHLAAMKALKLIKDNGLEPTSPNYKYVVA